jgi:small subunit ribosomal protein S2
MLEAELSRLTKKEGLMIEREINRLQIRLSGVRHMKRLPELLFVVDVSREDTAVHEANLKNIPVIALVDTNCDPRGVDYVIPSNDDAIRAIKLLVGKIADAVIEGRSLRKEEDFGEEEMEVITPTLSPRRVISIEDEVPDEDLFGEATLAKLTGRRATEEQTDEESDIELAEDE